MILRLIGKHVGYNGPSIGDSGGLESIDFQFCTNLSNSLLLFSKFIKKGNIKGCYDKKRRNFQFLSFPHNAKPLCLLHNSNIAKKAYLNTCKVGKSLALNYVIE